jgi:replicative superfamily II helicase
MFEGNETNGFYAHDWWIVEWRWPIAYAILYSCNSVGLVCVDEIHLLQEDRGSVLEGLITRYLIAAERQANIHRNAFERPPVGFLRVIGLSATCPNVEEVAQW